MIRNRSNVSGKEGYVLTPQRRLLLDILRKSTCHLDARELYRKAIRKDEAVSMATVYRSLKLFQQAGLIDEHRLDETRSCYEIRSSTQHHHVVCRRCGKVVEFESPLLAELVDRLQREKGFKIEKVELCIRAICEECRKTN